MSNEQTPQQGEELETDIEVEVEVEQQDADQEFVELTEDQQRIVELEAAVIAAESKVVEQKD